MPRIQNGVVAPLYPRDSLVVLEEWNRSLLKIGLLIIGLLCALAGSGDAFAYRPFDSTDAAVAEAGEFELELGPVEYLSVGEERFIVGPSPVFNLGVGWNSEIVLEGKRFLSLNTIPAARRTQLLDTALSVKKVLREGVLQDKEGPSIATEVGLLLPTLYGEPGVGATAAAILSQKGSMGAVHLNGSLSLTRAQHVNLFGGVILEGPSRWPVRPVAEFWTAGESGAGPAISGLLGAIWQARDNLSFDVAVRLARENHLPIAEIRAGLTWAFQVWNLERHPETISQRSIH